MNIEEKALMFAMLAHSGQEYKISEGGYNEPYVFHPIRVSLLVPRDCRVIALLHDVLEDTPYELPIWVSEEDHEIIKVLTRDKELETYREYILRIKECGGKAVTVKLADLSENMAHSPTYTLAQRYMWATEELLAEKERG